MHQKENQDFEALRNELLSHPALENSLKERLRNFFDTESTEHRLSNPETVTTFQLPSESTYKLIFENNPVGILHFNKDGIITACNNKFIDIMGSSRQKLLGLDMTKLPNKIVAGAANKAIHGQKAHYSGMYESVTSGKTMPLRATFEPIFNDSGEVLGGVGLIEDNTEIYETLENLRESERRYRSIFQKSSSVMLIIDPSNGAIFDANNSATDFYGWTREELKEKTVYDINTLPKSELKQELKSAREGTGKVFFFRHKKANGSIVDVEVFCGNIAIHNSEMLHCIVHDISERKRAMNDMRKFRLGIDRSSNAIFITDTAGDIEYVNPAFEKLYGYTSDEVLNSNPRLLQSGFQNKNYYEKFWNTIKAGEIMKGEIVNKTKDGKLLDIRFSSNPIIDDTGDIIGYIAIQSDITEQKEMEKQLRNSVYEKDIMLAEIHHRVKNNLAMISAILMLQSEKTDNSTLQEELLDSTNRIKAIANIHEHLYESTNFSRVDFAKNIKSLIQSIIESQAFKKKISVKNTGEICFLNINQSIYCSIIINEVVTNILNHAFKNRPKGSIEINLQEENGFITICIYDDGHPLPDSFPDEYTSGLGIELIHILARQLEGTFSFRSENGTSTFELTFKKADLYRDSFK
jgi:PAS domain S-box-containing protein